MAPTEIRDARKRLGLSARGLAEALRLGKDGGRTVRRWEAGDTPISGPASVAIDLLLAHSPDTQPEAGDVKQAPLGSGGK